MKHCMGFCCEEKPAGIAQLVEGQASDHEVMGSNLPSVTEVTLGGHPSGSLTISRCKIGTRPWPGQSGLMVHPSWLSNPQAESTETKY